MEVVKEVEHRFSPPQLRWQVPTLKVGTMSPSLSDTDQDLVKAVADWNHFSAKERIITSREEEEGLSNLIEDGCGT